ncbi:MAG: LuxR C-terminal-related transcriptional regulator [Candidatus Acidiferrales bacterium]
MASSRQIERQNIEWWAKTEKNAIVKALGVPIPAGLDTSSIGIAIFNHDCRCVLMSKALASMYGNPAKEYVGKTIRQTLGVYASQLEPAFRNVWTTGKSLQDIGFTVSLPGHSEKTQFVVNFCPFRNNTGDLRMIGIIFCEITNKKKLHDRFRDLNSRQKKAAFGENMPLGMESIELSAPPKIHQGLTVKSESRVQGKRPAECPSHRELQVIQLLAEGNSNKEVAAVLNLSIRTVETYRARLMFKLHLHSVAELVRYAIRNNLIKP